MKYKVQITRKEKYTLTVDVEADCPDKAREIAEVRERENEYAEKFQLPDEVETDFTVIDGNGGTPAKEEDEPTRYPPFNKLKVDCDVQWDYDEGDTPPAPHFEVSFTPEELESENILDRSNIEVTGWELYEGRLEEFMSEYLTSFTDFCHKGFTMNAKPIS